MSNTTKMSNTHAKLIVSTHTPLIRTLITRTQTVNQRMKETSVYSKRRMIFNVWNVGEGNLNQLLLLPPRQIIAHVGSSDAGAGLAPVVVFAAAVLISDPAPLLH